MSYKLTGSGRMDFDHSVDSNTIKISAFIRSSIGTEGTDVSKMDSCLENEINFFCELHASWGSTE